MASSWARAIVNVMVIGAVPSPPWWEDRLEGVSHVSLTDRGSRAWICVFSSTDRTIARSGGAIYRPTTSRTLVTSSGSVLNLNVSVRWGLRFASAQIRAMVEMLMPVRAAMARVLQWD